jgi:hypothetical protein
MEIDLVEVLIGELAKRCGCCGWLRSAWLRRLVGAARAGAYRDSCEYECKLFQAQSIVSPILKSFASLLARVIIRKSLIQSTG